MQFGRNGIARELGIERIDLTFGDGEIEALKQVGRRFRPGAVGQQQPVALANYRNSRPSGVLAEEKLKADSEYQRDPQQCRKCREQQSTLDFRQHRRRYAGMSAKLN